MIAEYFGKVKTIQCSDYSDECMNGELFLTSTKVIQWPLS